MCPFSHDMESSTRPAPCKYFAKGGCKFGRKCALLHITPDGTIVNRNPQFGQAPPFPPPQQPGPTPFAHPPPPGLLSMQAQGLEQRPNGEDFDNYHYAPRNAHEYPQIDVAYISTSPQYGSPHQDNNRFASSPPVKGLSVLDAPLPNSFDSNGISMAARNGPFAASVPSRFGVESPPNSIPGISHLGNTALRDLHSSAFGDRGMDGVLAGSSPPSGADEPLTFPKRSLHSDRLRAPRQQMISASLGTKLPTQSFEYSDDDDLDGTDREEDLLPSGLLDFMPEGKARAPTTSHPADDNENNTPATFLAMQRRTISTSNHGTPQDSKVGSPSAHSSSPSSRFPSGFGGWPTQQQQSSAGFGFPSSTTSRIASGDLSPTVGSPPRQASMSVLTQELQRSKIDAAAAKSQQAGAASAIGAVGMTRTFSNGSSTGRTSLDRALNGNGVGSQRIDEEPGLFDMDEVGDGARSAPRTIPNATQRNGGAWGSRAFGSSPGNGAPTFGAIGGHRTK